MYVSLHKIRSVEHVLLVDPEFRRIAWTLENYDRT